MKLASTKEASAPKLAPSKEARMPKLAPSKEAPSPKLVPLKRPLIHRLPSSRGTAVTTRARSSALKLTPPSSIDIPPWVAESASSSPLPARCARHCVAASCQGAPKRPARWQISQSGHSTHSGTSASGLVSIPIRVWRTGGVRACNTARGVQGSDCRITSDTLPLSDAGLTIDNRTLSIARSTATRRAAR